MVDFRTHSWGGSGYRIQTEPNTLIEMAIWGMVVPSFFNYSDTYEAGSCFTILTVLKPATGAPYAN